MSVADPHPWLGLDYRELLPGLRSGQHRFSLSLTRPHGNSVGAGLLRVVGVRLSESDAPKPHCILAYERYLTVKPGGQSNDAGR